MHTSERARAPLTITGQQRMRLKRERDDLREADPLRAAARIAHINKLLAMRG